MQASCRTNNNSKCIEDNTKAADRQSSNCIRKTKKTKIRRKTIFNMADGILSPCNVARGSGINILHSPGGSTLQCDTWLWADMTLNSPGDNTLQCDTWLWDQHIAFARWQHPAMWHVALGWHDIEFIRWQHPTMWHVALGSTYCIRQVAAPCNVTRGSGMTWHWIHQVTNPAMWHLALGWHDIKFARWQHHAMWHVALGWHALKFAQASDILEFYFRFRFRPCHRSRHVILHQPTKFIKIGPLTAKTMTSCRFSRWPISAILDFRGLIMGCLKSSCTTCHRSSIETVALNCLVFLRKSSFCILATDWLTNKQMVRPIALSRSRYRERRVNNVTTISKARNTVTDSACKQMNLSHDVLRVVNPLNFTKITSLSQYLLPKQQTTLVS